MVLNEAACNIASALLRCIVQRAHVPLVYSIDVCLSLDQHFRDFAGCHFVQRCGGIVTCAGQRIGPPFYEQLRYIVVPLRRRPACLYVNATSGMANKVGRATHVYSGSLRLQLACMSMQPGTRRDAVLSFVSRPWSSPAARRRALRAASYMSQPAPREKY